MTHLRTISLPSLFAAFLALASASAQAQESVEPKKRSVDIAGGVSMTLVYIEPGSFTMATPQATWDGGDSDERQLTVMLTQGFWMSETEVTQAQWEAIMGPGAGVSASSDASARALPVSGVSWNEAQDFCENLSARSGNAFSLPSEAQWEYAARAGEKTDYAIGDEYIKIQTGFDPKTYVAESSGQVVPVRGQKPNAFGLRGMHGNVAEWCLDWLGDYPTDEEIRDYVGLDETSGERIYRAGSLGSAPAKLEPEARAKLVRSSAPPDAQLKHVGFRVIAVAHGEDAQENVEIYESFTQDIPEEEGSASEEALPSSEPRDLRPQSAP
jgi:formylglycine-generating enzyme required for sulfatase activity